MNRFFLFFALMALLASCDLNMESVEKSEPGKGSDPAAIDFGVYVNRGTSTKAGWGGNLTTDTLKNYAGGFGVFSYFGNGAMYNETSKPDFMYNQQVTFETPTGSNGVWIYSPIKYWPNEFGDAASSQGADRLTFFAYAPYVKVAPATGLVVLEDTDPEEAAETGIVGMTRNISAGDPQVRYRVNFKPGAGVDLCWGVAAAEFKSSVDGEKNDVKAGEPFINVIKPKTGDRLQFEFNHALSQLNVQIKTDSDVASDPDTKIYVRSVTFTGFATAGSLNLNSKKGNPVWYDISGTGRLRRDPVTVYDGRTDGLEGVTSAVDAGETPAGLNPDIVQSKPYSGTPTPGVTGEAVNLFDNDSKDAPVLVIPQSGVPMTVNIVYDVETKDANLAGCLSDGVTPGISVENSITKTVQFNTTANYLEPGKKYVLNLSLGLTSVKFDALVASWDNTAYEATVGLPNALNDLGSVYLTYPTGEAFTSSATVWINDSFNKPVVKVQDADGQDVTSESTLAWTSSDEDVATVAADGSVTLQAPGTSSIKVTATYNGQSLSASYTLNVNAVTGVTLVPETADIVLGGSLALTATLEINGGNGINGTISNWNAVVWSSSSNHNAVPVNPDGNPYKDGETLVAKAIASTTADAQAGDVADIKAIVAESFAASTLSDKATLTCVAVSIKSVTLSSTDTTVWKADNTLNTPTVTSVIGTDNSDLTSVATVKWSYSDASVAEVPEDGGFITLHKAGVIEIVATVTIPASTASPTGASKQVKFTVNSNEVTGISLDPTTAAVPVNGTVDIGTDIAMTQNGDYATLSLNTPPSVSWSSESPSYVSITPSTSGKSATAKGVAVGGSSKVSATIPAAYTSTNADMSASCTVTCSNTTSGTGNGYSGWN